MFSRTSRLEIVYCVLNPYTANSPSLSNRAGEIRPPEVGMLLLLHGGVRW